MIANQPANEAHLSKAILAPATLGNGQVPKFITEKQLLKEL
jgi:hypothetical protein